MDKLEKFLLLLSLCCFVVMVITYGFILLGQSLFIAAIGVSALYLAYVVHRNS